MSHPGTLLFPLMNWISRFTRRKTIRVYFKHHSCIGNVGTEVMKRLSSSVNVISVSNEEECDVRVFFCPIVSRAGTDIEAALFHVSDGKPTIMVVLHHTFDIEYAAPNSSRYEREKLILVDMLFHEDIGLLRCLKNNIAISNAVKFLKEYSRRQHVDWWTIVENVMPEVYRWTNVGNVITEVDGQTNVGNVITEVDWWTIAKEIMLKVLKWAAYFGVGFFVCKLLFKKEQLELRTVPEKLFRIYRHYLWYRCYYHYHYKFYYYYYLPFY